jgi:hypothetical protein
MITSATSAQSHPDPDLRRGGPPPGAGTGRAVKVGGGGGGGVAGGAGGGGGPIWGGAPPLTGLELERFGLSRVSAGAAPDCGAAGTTVSGVFGVLTPPAAGSPARDSSMARKLENA